jgi:hypothetical protein
MGRYGIEEDDDQAIHHYTKHIDMYQSDDDVVYLLAELY